MSVFVAVRVRPLSQPSATQRPSLHLQLQEPDHNDGASSSLYAVDLISATTVTFTPEAIEASEHSRWARAAEVRGLTPPATARQGSTPRAGVAPPPPLLSSSGVALPRRHHDTPAFDFDVCFSSEPRHPNYATQADVYDCVGVPILDAFLRGLNGCILAYGQTGSGKTYSMLGPYGEELNRVQHTRAVNTQRELLVQPQRPPRAPSLPGGAVPSLGRAAVAPSLDNSFVGSDFSTVAARGAVGGVGAVHLQRLFHDPERGIMLRLVDDLFARLSLLEEEAMRDRRMCRLDLQVTYYQVYREKVYCLLQPRADRRAAPLRVREDHRGAYIEGLTQHNVRCVEDVLALLELGTMHRRVATTTKNDVSSRSHAVFTVRLRRVGDSEDSSFVSTLHLVDLAGSERTGTQTSSTPTDSQGAGSGTFGPKATAAAASHIGETSDINAALSCLGRVIHVLAQNSINATAAQQSQSPTRRSTARSMTPPASSRGGPQQSRSSAGRRQSPAPSHHLPNTSAAVVKPLHVPYRESTLTFLLKDCLGGNARTAMLSTISPSFADLGETLSTLRYASRARRIINHPIANTDARSAEVAATLRAEIRELQAQLRDAANDAQLRELQEQLQFREQGMQDYEDRLREAEAQRSEWEIERAELLEKVIVVTQERSYMESLLQSSQEANRMLKRRLESVGQTVEDVEVAMQFAGGALTSSSVQADDEKDDHIYRDRPLMGASRNIARDSQPTQLLQQQDGNEESEGGRREDSPVVVGAGGVLSSRGDSERTSQTASTTTQQQQSQIAQPTTVTIAPMNWREVRKNDGVAVGAVSGAPEGRRSPAIIFGRKPSLPPTPATTASEDLLEHDEESVDNKLPQHPSSSSLDGKKQRQVEKQQRPDLQSKSPPPSSSSPLQNRWQLPERYRWMLQQASEDHHDEHDEDEDEEAFESSAMVLTQRGSSAAVRMPPPSTRTAPNNAASTTQPPTRNKHNTAAAAGPAVPRAATSLDPPVDIDPPPLCDRTQEPASPSSTDEQRRNPSSRRYRMGGDGDEEVDKGEEEDRLDRLDNASLLDEAKRIGIDIDSLLQNVKKQKKKHHHSNKHEKKETTLSSPSQPPTWNTSPKHHLRPTNGSATAAEKPPIGKSAAAPSASPPRPFSGGSRPTAIGVPSALPPSPSSKTTSAASLLFHPNQKPAAPSAAVAVKPLPPPPFAVPPPLQKVSSSSLSATTTTQTPNSHRGTNRPQPQLADRSGEVILRESQQQQPLGATVSLPQRGSSSSDVVAVNPNTPRTNRRPVAAEGPLPPPLAATPVGSHNNNNNSGSSGSSSNAAVERYRQLLRDQTAPKLRQ